LEEIGEYRDSRGSFSFCRTGTDLEGDSFQRVNRGASGVQFSEVLRFLRSHPRSLRSNNAAKDLMESTMESKAEGKIFQIVLQVIAGLFGIAAVIVGWILANKSDTPNMSPLPVSLPDSGIVMVAVPAGEFLMGTTSSAIRVLAREHTEWKEAAFGDETPQRLVRLDPYLIGKYEITNAQYEKFLQAHPGYHLPSYWANKAFNSPMQPVVGIDWNDAVAYCDWLAETTGKTYRLPTEAQWEMAARGGDSRIFPWGQDWPNGKSNFQNQAKAPLAVGTFPSGRSESGLYDMAGNVAEWCLDWYGEKYYREAVKCKNPVGSLSGIERVVRGGSWQDVAFYLRCAARMKHLPDARKETLGFRIVKLP
jgi:formylglycine-generating enzyme